MTTPPDSPAFPRQPTNFVDTDGPSVVYGATGLSAIEFAGIQLLQPTGTPWLDAMIEKRRRDEFAKAALDSRPAGVTLSPELVRHYFEIAEAMTGKEPAP